VREQVAVLRKQVAARSKALLAVDRRLAKDIGAWTERAMTQQERPSDRPESGGGGGSGLGGV
jgi:hypothetical protein